MAALIAVVSVGWIQGAGPCHVACGVAYRARNLRLAMLIAVAPLCQMTGLLTPDPVCGVPSRTGNSVVRQSAKFLSSWESCRLYSLWAVSLTPVM